MPGWPFRLMVYGAGEAIDGGGAWRPRFKSSSHASRASVPARTSRRPRNSIRRACPRGVSCSIRRRRPVLEMPNVNVGNPRELVNFVSWSAATCPAQQ